MSSWLGQLSQAAEKARQVAAETAEAAQKAAVDAAQKAAEEAAKLSEELQDKAKQYANELQEGASAFAQSSEDDDGLSFKFQFGPGPLGFKLGADEAGIHVTTVVAGGQAAKHGVNVGDRLFAIDGVRLPSNPAGMTPEQAEQKVKDVTVKLRNQPRPVVLTFGFAESSQPSVQQASEQQRSTDSATGETESNMIVSNPSSCVVAPETANIDLNNDWENVDFDVDERDDDRSEALPLADDVSPIVTPSGTPLANSQIRQGTMPSPSGETSEDLKESAWENADFDFEETEKEDDDRLEDSKPQVPEGVDVFPMTPTRTPAATQEIEAEAVPHPSAEISEDMKGSAWENADFDFEEPAEKIADDVKPNPSATPLATEEAQFAETSGTARGNDSACMTGSEQELQSLRSEYEKFRQDTKQKLELAESGVREKQERIDKLQEDLEATQSDSEFRIEELQAARLALEEEKVGVEAALAAEKEKAEAKVHEIENLRNQCNEKEQQILEASAQLSQASSKEADLKSSLSASEEKEQSLGKELEALRVEYDDFRESARKQLQDRESRADENLQQERRQKEILQEELEIARRRNEDDQSTPAQEALDAARQELDALRETSRQQLEAAEAREKETSIQKQEQINALTEELESIRASAEIGRTAGQALEDLQNEYNEFRETANQQLEDAMKSKESLQQALLEKQALEDTLQEEVELLRKSGEGDSAISVALEETRHDCAKLEEEYTALKSTTKETIAKKDKELEGLQEQLDLARRSSDHAASQALEDVRIENDKIKEQLARQLEEAELRAKDAMDIKEKQITELVDQLQSAQRNHGIELEELQKAKAACQSALEVSERDKAQLDAEVAAEKDRIASLVAAGEDLQARCKAQELQLASAASLEKELKDSRNELEQSRAQVEEMQAAQDGCMRSAAEARKQALVRCQSLEQDLTSARNEFDEACREANDSKRRLAQAEQDIETWKNRFETLRVDHEKKTTEFKKSQATDLDGLRQDFRETQQQLKQTQLELERSRVECQELSDSATQRDNRVNAATALLENRAEKLQGDVDKISQERDSALLQSRQIAEDLNRARAQLKAAQENTQQNDARHQGESDALKACISALETEVAQLSEKVLAAERQALAASKSKAQEAEVDVEVARSADLRVAAAEEKVIAAEQQASAAEDKAMALEKKLMEADTRLESARSESDSHRQLVRTLQTQLAEQQNEFTLQLSAQRSEYEKQKQLLNQAVESGNSVGKEAVELSDQEFSNAEIGKSKDARKGSFETGALGKEPELPPEKAGQEETVALRERIDLLENRCATLQNRLSARPIIYQHPIADGNDPLALESGTTASVSRTAINIVEKALRKFTHRLLQRDKWLFIFYAHLVVLYLISGSCFSSSRTPAECMHLKLVQSSPAGGT